MRAMPIQLVIDNGPQSIVLDERPVLISVIDEVPYAIGDTCPHNGASLSEGLIKDDCVTCPWHFWRFSLTSGEQQGSARMSVPSYPCTVQDGWIHVELPVREKPMSMREMLLAHARGES